YNANPTSMNAAIDSFKENRFENKIMFLGDMLELGDTSKSEHQAIVNKTLKLGINAIFVGKEFSLIENKHSFTYLKNVNEVIDWLKHSGLTNHQILIKGSRGIRLEGAAQFLQQNP
ncbi:MAG: cyanophycin synthetase, partial [Vicingaceae bacterium]|nr:cyanophycin synthetase [Vicingaceae bacterium]